MGWHVAGLERKKCPKVEAAPSGASDPGNGHRAIVRDACWKWRNIAQ